MELCLAEMLRLRAWVHQPEAIMGYPADLLYIRLWTLLIR